VDILLEIAENHVIITVSWGSVLAIGKEAWTDPEGLKVFKIFAKINY